MEWPDEAPAPEVSEVSRTVGRSDSCDPVAGAAHLRYHDPGPGGMAEEGHMGGGEGGGDLTDGDHVPRCVV